MKLSTLFPHRYACGAELQGKDITVTIRAVELETMRANASAPSNDKAVVYFHETQKGVVLSKTLAYQIAAALHSDETDEWAGRQVTLYPEAVTVAGTPRMAIRARISAA
jgi:hypothetical protein